MPTYVVGPGIARAMSEDETTPASDEIYVNGSRTEAQWSEAMALSGALYRWVRATNRVYRFSPGGRRPADGWTPAIGAAIAAENFWDPNGQPTRRAAMERFNRLPREQRRAIFEEAMEAALTAEGINDPAARASWQGAMRLVVAGGQGIVGENPDLNPFMLAGESGGVFRGGANALDSSALGYFQFLATHRDNTDYGHWSNYMPGVSRSMMTNPTAQVQQFIRAIRRSGKHHGDPWSVVEEKRQHGWWGP